MIPATRTRETVLRNIDEAEGWHWVRARCWCGAVHDGTGTGLTLVAPPWEMAAHGGNEE